MQQVCRTCLTKNNMNMRCLFKENLTMKIKAISEIEVRKEDGLSTLVCEECLKSINESYEFRKKIIESDHALKYLNEGNKEQNLDQMPCETILKVEDDIIEAETNEVDNCQSAENEFWPENDLSENSRAENAFDENTNFMSENFSYKKRSRTTKSKHSICPICDKSISTQNFRKHLKVHSDKKQVTCNICGKVFKNKGAYNSHPVMHQKEHNICEFCGKQFEFKGEYIRHKKYHTNTMNDHSICNICGKTLWTRHLQKHIRTHTGERPFPCKYCQKCFSSRYALKTHIRQHTHDTPYICHICSTKFNQKVSLKTHFLNKHFLSPSDIKAFFDKMDEEKKKKI